ncbi:FAD:protein FMN transferase [Maliponia aquimaris]|uniref:FAD:protein FMN transferase n=1 Tax=Maliponia aquimaris TaxID=1673631 RepID=A0A238KM67_9RHOB|nr:FAD:protein FMN transferase [Maliponia aquimaris]SMX43136.1 Thiamine biosynthesis lipoprotein ApbE precursor [Maliponia aquimaris]
MNRRRFLTLSAAFACAPRLAHAATWRGVALGADVSVTLSGPRGHTDAVLAGIPAELDRIERLFSLYRPDSDLSVLNRTGQLRPSAPFRALLDLVDTAHRLTDGLFDPTIQPLWSALAQGGDADVARQKAGWHRVRRDSDGTIRLGPQQALTLNGIAQGYATDLIRRQLQAAGFDRALVDIGEQAAIGGPFRLGLVDPDHGMVGTRTLTDLCIATSSPGALRLGAAAHILAPDGRPPLWSTVSIETRTDRFKAATLADALSTAAVFMPLDALRRLKQAAALHRVTVVDVRGDVATL